MNKLLAVAPVTVVLLVCACTPDDLVEGHDYEVGGPLAGVKLPLYGPHHGEQPGHPGCVPELMAKAEDVHDMGQAYREWGPQGL